MPVRRARVEDAAALARLHIDSWRVAYRGLVPDSRLDSLDYGRRAERFRDQLSDHGPSETVLLERKGEILGFVTLGACRDPGVEPESTGEIWGIYLAPQHWRRGAGTLLCRFAERLLASRGSRETKLWVLGGNDQARRFYEAMGFAPDGESKVLDFDAPLEAVRYAKQAHGVTPGAVERAARIVREMDAIEQWTAPMRELRRAFNRELLSLPGEFVLEVAHAIVATGRHCWIAYELAAAHRAAFHALDQEQLEALGLGIDNWSGVDAFARTVSGPAWRMGLLAAAAIRDWALSTDPWWRRAALVSTVALNVRSRGGRGDPGRTLEVCEMLAGDQEKMVAKALSWALRELVVHDPEAVRSFLRRHGQILASRVRREVTNKLETGLKNP